MSLNKYIYIYIYVYASLSITLYIYIYIYVFTAGSSRRRPGEAHALADLPHREVLAEE